MDTNRQLSLLISDLRLPMMIGIVFIHTHFFKYLDAGLLASFTAFNAVSYIVTDLLCQLFVPAFFIISGYLFFKERNLTPELYAGKLKNRFFSLVVPYLFWNGLMLLIMYLQERMLGATSQRMGQMSEYGLSDWIYAFVDDNRNHSFTGTIGQPASVQFWFIRDLIVICLFSPVIYRLVRWNKYAGIAILAAVYFLPWHLPHVKNLSFFYFGLGVWLRQYDIDIIHFAKKTVWYCIPITLAAMTGNYFAQQNEMDYTVLTCRLIFILAGLLVIVAAVAALQQKRGQLLPQKIQQSSFFVFAYHIVPTAVLCGAVCRWLPINNLTLIAAYLIIPFVVTAAGVALYLLLSRFMPRFTSVITGGR